MATRLELLEGLKDEFFPLFSGSSLNLVNYENWRFVELNCLQVIQLLEKLSKMNHNRSRFNQPTKKISMTTKSNWSIETPFKEATEFWNVFVWHKSNESWTGLPVNQKLITSTNSFLNSSFPVTSISLRLHPLYRWEEKNPRVKSMKLLTTSSVLVEVSLYCSGNRTTTFTWENLRR